jgi:hypothetical protein
MPKCRACNIKLNDNNWYRCSKKWNHHICKKCSDTNCKKYNRKTIKEIKAKILYLLGKKCTKCGFTDVRALQIDHKSGGGTKERKLYDGYRHYKKLRDMSDADIKTRFQLLCANCNWIKRCENEE